MVLKRPFLQVPHGIETTSFLHYYGGGGGPDARAVLVGISNAVTAGAV